MEDLIIEYTTQRNEDNTINNFRTIKITGEELVEILSRDEKLSNSINISIGEEPHEYKHVFYGMKLE